SLLRSSQRHYLELPVAAEEGCAELQALLAVGGSLRQLAGAAGAGHAGGVLDRPADLLEGERFVRRTGVGAVGGEERGGGVAFGRDLEAAIGAARGERERHHGDEQQG